jgi:hypothetical protein
MCHDPLTFFEVIEFIIKTVTFLKSAFQAGVFKGASCGDQYKV